MPEGVVKIWDVAGGKEFASIPGHSAAVTQLAFNANGTLLVSHSEDRETHVWDLVARKRRTTLETAIAAGALDLHPDGGTLAMGSGNGSVLLWDLANGKFRELPIPTEMEQINAVVFSHDGKSLIAGGTEDFEAVVWDMTTGKPNPPLDPAKQ